MAQLEIALLGTVQVRLDGCAQVAFETEKTRALLAYLAVESNRPHRRPSLAAIFWPNFADGAARNSLRQTLYRLRQAIADPENTIPHLLVSVHDVQFNIAADNWLDVEEFNSLIDVSQKHHPHWGALCDTCVRRLEMAVELYQGNFLAGFNLPDSPDFESWLLLKQEHYHRRTLEALSWLGNHCERTGAFEQETAWAMKEIELEPWRESAHRRAMRALALSGQRQAALHQYEACRQILESELGVAPVADTVSLHEAIRDWVLVRKPTTDTHQAQNVLAFPTAPGPASAYEPSFSSFVGFADELAKLDFHLKAALAGQGNVVFVTGQTGSGKTTLMGRFTSRAMQTYSELLAAAGHCDARYGLGIPYQPFAEILRTLGEAGSISDWLRTVSIEGLGHQDHLQRTSAGLPVFVQAVIGRGPELVGTLLSREAIVQRLRCSEVLDKHSRRQLEELVTAQLTQGSSTARGDEGVLGKALNWGQALLLDQVTRVLEFVAEHYPLLLILDDLQWADLATISLLLHLGRQLENRRILIIAACRAEVLSSAEREKSHPLEAVFHELQRQYGDLLINLDRTNGYEFVNKLVDSELNKIESSFRTSLFRRTTGNPLFTVELMRGLVSQGYLVRDTTDQWVISPSLDWAKLPSRVTGVIAEHIRKLSLMGRSILSAASLQGSEFIAEVVAEAIGYDTDMVIHYLSSTAGKAHHLVRAFRVEFVNGRRLSRYRFLQTLYQQYFYHELDEVERSLLTEATRAALKTAYGAQGERWILEPGDRVDVSREMNS